MDKELASQVVAVISEARLHGLCAGIINGNPNFQLRHACLIAVLPVCDYVRTVPVPFLIEQIILRFDTQLYNEA